jgi:outer membrane protein OmpA-like peptidoglycan-associated protein
MAFNLNKNEPTDPSKKFDLSKTDSPTATVPQPQEGKSKIWVFALLGLLVIGVGAWFFLSKSNSGSGNENAATAAVKPDSVNVTSVVQNDVAPTTADTMKQVATENAVATNTAATTAGNTVPDPGNNNPDRTTAAGFNNRIPATFAKGSTSISNLDQRLVKELIAFLKKDPAAVINIDGYASSEGELAINQQISRSRADAFKSYLVSKGIPGNRINSTGRGIDNPINSNDTEEGRIKNRRIEISIH